MHKSLLEIKMIAGVEKKMAIANGTICLALTMGTEQPGFIGVMVIIHFVLRWITKNDPFTIDVYSRYATMGDVYDPWPRRSTKVNKRPEGFGKDLLC